MILIFTFTLMTSFAPTNRALLSTLLLYYSSVFRSRSLEQDVEGSVLRGRVSSRVISLPSSGQKRRTLGRGGDGSRHKNLFLLFNRYSLGYLYL